MSTNLVKCLRSFQPAQTRDLAAQDSKVFVSSQPEFYCSKFSVSQPVDNTSAIFSVRLTAQTTGPHRTFIIHACCQKVDLYEFVRAMFSGTSTDDMTKSMVSMDPRTEI